MDIRAYTCIIEYRDKSAKNIYKIYIIWVFVDKTGGILARRINKYAEDKFK